MKTVLVFIALFGLSAASPQILAGLSSQYRYQDELGQHAFGHVGGPNSREEVKTADGVTRGSYSYVDANGIVQSAVYSADAVNGFRVAATNLPVGPAVPAAGPSVVAAAPSVVAAHSVLAAPSVVAAHSAVLPSVISARYAYPSAILGAPVVHALKKRDLVAVGQPLTSYPGSTAPLVHTVPVAHVAAAPLAYAASVAHSYVAHSYAAHPLLAHVLKKRSVVALPADTPEVAHAKAAQLIQQNTEAIRNNFGGIPLALPADTPEVANAKAAHAIAHANEAARNYPLLAAPLSYSAVAPLAYSHPAPLAYSATGLHYYL